MRKREKEIKKLTNEKLKMTEKDILKILTNDRHRKRSWEREEWWDRECYWEIVAVLQCSTKQSILLKVFLEWLLFSQCQSISLGLTAKYFDKSLTESEAAS